MPTHTVRPNGAGTFTTWTPSSGSNWQCVDESSADEDTTKLTNTGSGSYDTYAHTAGTPSSITISNFSITYRSKSSITNGLNAAAIVIVDGNVYSGSFTLTSTSYANYSYSWATNPDTGVAWTTSDINNCEIGFLGAVGGGVTGSTTQVYGTVTYEDAPSGTSILTLPNLTLASTGKQTHTGTSVAVLPSLVLAAYKDVVGGTIVATLPSLNSLAYGIATPSIPTNQNTGSPRRLIKPGGRL